MVEAKLSIITVTMNDLDGLRRTLASIEAQTQGLDEIECVVVDGGCDAEVRNLVSEVSAFSVRLISEVDSGVYDGMNKGWRASRGAYAQFLNSGDCLAGSNSLAVILSGLRTGPLWAVFGALHLMAGNRPPVVIGNLPHVWWRHALGLQAHCHQSSIFHRDLLASTKGYSLERGFVADFDLIMLAGLLATPAQISDVVVHYEGGGMSATRSAEIPRLQSVCRRSRLQLSGPARTAETLWTAYAMSRAAARGFKHRIAQRRARR
jgi:hypothetical protein